MSRRRWLTLVAPALLGAGAMLFGCGRRAPSPPPPPPPPKTAATADFMLHTPCVLSSPLQHVLISYRKQQPAARVRVGPAKPLAMLGTVRKEAQLPGVVVTLGEVEMQSFVRAGVVEPRQVVPLARNTYQLAVIVPAANTSVKRVTDVTKVARLAIEDPALSTLGNRAQAAFTTLGLWPKLAPKIVRFDPEQNVLSQLLDGKADAAVVFEDCLLEGGSPPNTVRIVGTLPSNAYAPIVYQVAPLKTRAPSAAVQQFMTFLASPAGKQALREAKLSPM